MYKIVGSCGKHDFSSELKYFKVCVCRHLCMYVQLCMSALVKTLKKTFNRSMKLLLRSVEEFMTCLKHKVTVSNRIKNTHKNSHLKGDLTIFIFLYLHVTWLTEFISLIFSPKITIFFFLNSLLKYNKFKWLYFHFKHFMSSLQCRKV